jgi:hypothetical protein
MDHEDPAAIPEISAATSGGRKPFRFERFASEASFSVSGPCLRAAVAKSSSLLTPTIKTLG